MNLEKLTDWPFAGLLLVGIYFIYIVIQRPLDQIHEELKIVSRLLLGVNDNFADLNRK